MKSKAANAIVALIAIAALRATEDTVAAERHTVRLKAQCQRLSSDDRHRRCLNGGHGIGQAGADPVRERKRLHKVRCPVKSLRAPKRHTQTPGIRTEQTRCRRLCEECSCQPLRDP